MPRVSAAFFAAASVCLLLGMSWGIQMGATENFTMMPAHAHLNLLGWVTMALYGTFYALTPNTLCPRLAWVNFALSVIGVLLMIPFLALFLGSRDTSYVGGMVAGEIVTVLSLLVFGVSVGRELLRPRT
jgi:hypothetical protein